MTGMNVYGMTSMTGAGLDDWMSVYGMTRMTGAGLGDWSECIWSDWED